MAPQSGGHLRDIHSLIGPFSGVLDTWHPHIYDLSQPENSDQWGTTNPMNEMVGREMQNDVDHGVFVAPPV